MYKLHDVIVHKKVGDKTIDLREAKKIAKQYIEGDKRYVRETETSYRFRNLPKTFFVPNSYGTKVINDTVSLVYGELKTDSDQK